MNEEIINLKVMVANLDLSINSKEKLYNQISKISYLGEKQENIIKEVREYIEEHTTYENYGYIDELQLIDLDFSIKDLKQILDKEVN